MIAPQKIRPQLRSSAFWIGL